MALVHQLPTVVSLPSEQEAALSYKLATNAAGLCKAIILETAVKIQGRKYVRSEGWLAIAAAHGCVVSVRDVEKVDGGLRAIAELRRLSDQSLIATAEGFVGDDEPTWAKRPMFARRAMVQTRASSRVCRTVFAHVPIMVDASLGTTPAEEMQGVYDHEPSSVDGPGSGGKEAFSNPRDFAQEALAEGLTPKGETRSQYQVDKFKAAVTADWKVTNTTAKGQKDQVVAYLNMARTPDHVSKILNNNEQVIANSGAKDAIDADADHILRWMEGQIAQGVILE